MGDMTIAGMYGYGPSPQPQPTATPDHLPGQAEPTVRTTPLPGAQGVLDNPVFVLVALLGAAALLSWIRVHGSIELDLP